MRTNLREKALRIILSSILTSDLSANDIRILSQSFTKDRDFSWDLGTALKDVANRLYLHSFEMKSRDQASDISNQVYAALSAIKRRRLSKKTLLQYMSQVSPNNILLDQSAKLSAKELLVDFFNTSSSASKSELSRLLEQRATGGDDYLQGIMRKR